MTHQLLASDRVLAFAQTGKVLCVNRSGKAYLTPAIHDGRWMTRVSIGALPTERSHVEALWALLRETAEG